MKTAIMRISLQSPSNDKIFGMSSTKRHGILWIGILHRRLKCKFTLNMRIHLCCVFDIARSMRAIILRSAFTDAGQIYPPNRTGGVYLSY